MTPRTKLILSILAVLVLLVAFYFFFIRPRQQELVRVEESIEAEEARTTQLRAELARLQDLQANAPELEAELARIRGFVPRDDEIPNFIFLVQDAANESGVDFVSITPALPKPPPEGAALAEIQVQIGAGGGYFAVQDFIRRLHALDRAVRLDTLSMSSTEEEGGEVSITLDTSARIFFEVPGGATGAAAPAGTAPPPAEAPPAEATPAEAP